ncbi:MAG: hypothetical protein HUK03_09795, partial [Bacteroidaceae bacterium]|nr:hypothetical protein [Bacteroidaceae bacterium]
WVGTSHGLCRYNGSRVMRYVRHLNDEGSLPDNYIRSLYMDDEGTLWVGTDKGLCRYQEATNTFCLCTGHRREVPSVAQTPDGRLLCSAPFLCEVDTKTLTISPAHNAEGERIKRTPILLATDDGHVWTGGKDGVSEYDKDWNLLYRHKTTAADDKRGGVTALVCDDSCVWVGLNGDGVLCVNRHSKRLRKLCVADGLADDVVHSLCLDKSGNVWVGTQDGLSVCTNVGGEWQITNFRQDRQNAFSVGDNNIFSLLCDSHGNVWVGTYYGGLFLHRPDSGISRYYSARDDGGGLRGKVVSGLQQDANRLWVATEDGGLHRLNLQTGEVVPLPLPGLRAMNLHALQLDGEGGLWIGTFMHGLVHYRPDSNTTTVYDCHNSILHSDYVYALLRDRSGNVWVGTTEGLYRMDSRTGRMEHILLESNPSTFVFCLAEDSVGRIWVGTRSVGLMIYDTRTGEVTHMNDDDKSLSLSDNFITALAPLQNGDAWVGTNNGGLLYYSSEDGVFRSLSADGSVPGQCVYAMTRAADGNVWASVDGDIYR